MCNNEFADLYVLTLHPHGPNLKMQKKTFFKISNASSDIGFSNLAFSWLRKSWNLLKIVTFKGLPLTALKKFCVYVPETMQLNYKENAQLQISFFIFRYITNRMDPQLKGNPAVCTLIKKITRPQSLIILLKEPPTHFKIHSTLWVDQPHYQRKTI